MKSISEQKWRRWRDFFITTGLWLCISTTASGCKVDIDTYSCLGRRLLWGRCSHLWISCAPQLSIVLSYKYIVVFFSPSSSLVIFASTRLMILILDRNIDDKYAAAVSFITGHTSNAEAVRCKWKPLSKTVIGAPFPSSWTSEHVLIGKDPCGLIFPSHRPILHTLYVLFSFGRV